MFTTSDAFDNQVLVALITPPAAGLLAQAKFHLVTQVVQLSKQSFDPSVMVEATFPGYAAKVPTGSRVIRGPSNLLCFTTAPMEWNPTGPDTPETIVGYYMEAPTGLLAGWEYFAQPVSLVDASSMLVLVVQICFATPPQGQADMIT